MSEPHLAHCLVCGSTAIQPSLTGLYDDRYGYPGRFDLFACANCGHQFLDAVFPPEKLQHLYTNYYPRSGRSLDDWQPHRELSAFRLWLARGRNAVFRWVPRGVKVLDVGCGFGESLGYHRARGCEVWGVETDENILRVAERFDFKVRVGVFRATDFPREYFDFVTLDQVIEHGADPLALLRDAATVLRPGGTLLLSTPNARSLLARALGRRWVHWHTPYHLQLFSKPSLAAAARAAGLRVLWCRNLTSPQWYHFQWLHLLSRPEPGVPSMFWTPGGAWPRRRWLARKLLSGLNRLGFNHAVSFWFDHLGQGDNLVMALEWPRE